jgi:hypothetical protein
VIGSYLAAETLRKRRRNRMSTRSAVVSQEPAREPVA